ncbi:putative fungal specific transcription factor domain-containing protein [Rosellinia necatrix]|uniref:Putative fungal specific transcription factor domain-containing protein n=1 Tax=Rosellinia necatrix TaxID=77044 RepID=A0A1S8A9F6_ROSNE|nr:putative fungal specific transcription factor domain-containing protein [Rosellinia necatrix]
MNSPASPSPLLRRPNGRPQACEPCRKRKVACDHTQPTCHRCRKRRQEDDCVYLVSSSSGHTTTITTTGGTTHTPRRPLPPSPARSASSTVGPPPPPRSVAATAAAATTDGLDAAESRSTDPGQMASGYLGFTSFSAVYEETQSRLNTIQGSSGGTTTPSETTTTTTAATAAAADEYGGQGTTSSSAPDRFALDARTRDDCLFVLRNVPEPPPRGGGAGVRLRGSPCEAWYYHLLERALASFYDAFGHLLGPRRGDAALGALAATLSRNTALPFPEGEGEGEGERVRPGRWIAQFSGPCTRWETIGLLFAFWDFGGGGGGGVGCASAGQGQGYRPIRDEDGRPSRVAKRCVDICVDLCHEFSPANSMLLFLSHKRLILETVLHGDMS